MFPFKILQKLKVYLNMYHCIYMKSGCVNTQSLSNVQKRKKLIESRQIMAIV